MCNDLFLVKCLERREPENLSAHLAYSSSRKILTLQVSSLLEGIQWEGLVVARVVSRQLLLSLGLPWAASFGSRLRIFCSSHSYCVCSLYLLPPFFPSRFCVLLVFVWLFFWFGFLLLIKFLSNSLAKFMLTAKIFQSAQRTPLSCFYRRHGQEGIISFGAWTRKLYFGAGPTETGMTGSQKRPGHIFQLPQM